MTKALRKSLAVGGLWLFGCGGTTPTPDPLTGDLDGIKGTKDTLTAVYAESIRHSPSLAVLAGDRTVDAELDQLTADEFTKYYARMAKLAEKMKALDAKTFSAEEQLSYDMALTTVNDAAARKIAKTELWEASNLNDAVDLISYFPSAQTLTTQADVDAYVARCQKIPTYLTQRLANLKAGADQGLTSSKPVLEAMLGNVTGYYGLKAADGSPWAAPSFADSVSMADQMKWTTQITTVVDQTLVPAFAAFVAGVQKDVLPKARTTFGYGAMGQNGKDFYQSQIAFHTGGTQTADALHQLGLTRVAELEAKLKEQLMAVGINEPTLVAGLEKAKALPESMPANAADLKTFVDGFVEQLRADAWSKQVFGVASPAKPTINYPDTSGTPFYVAGTSTITVPLKSATLVSSPSVLAHEYTHYLQDLVTKSTMPVSKYQPLFGSYVLAEGAAHYAETLALGSSLYTRPTARETALVKLNAYSDLMLRAVRLVVDTGIHSKDWSRQQALDYLTSHVIMGADQAAFEIDRYASWPGQALAYRVGMENIKAEHDRAATAIGAGFNEGAFNTMVLSLSGATSRLLTQRTDAMIAGANKQ